MNINKDILALLSDEDVSVILIALKDHQFSFEQNQATADRLVKYFERHGTESAIEKDIKAINKSAAFCDCGKPFICECSGNCDRDE